MITLIRNLGIFFHSRNELFRTIFLSQSVFLISSGFELMGILLLGPLIFLATSGEEAMTNENIMWIYNLLNFNAFESFFLFFFILTISLILVGVFSSIFSVTLVSKISTGSGVTLGNRLLSHYISLNWSDIKSISNTKIINEIYQESSRVTENIFVPFMMISKSSILCFFILLGLLYIDPYLTVLFFIFLSSVYFLMYFLFRAGLYKNSAFLTYAHEQRLLSLSNIFEMFKQIKIWGNAKYFQDHFNQASLTWGRAYRKNLNVALLPRYFVEASILLAAATAIYLSAQPGLQFADSLAKTSIFLFSAFKLLPAIQSLYYSSSQIRGNIYALENILSTMKKYNHFELKHKNTDGNKKDITEIKNILFQNIYFTYPNSDKTLLQNINVTFTKDKIYGLTGPSGAGKSTFCDILMGLLLQDEGSILVNGDEAIIYENKLWFKNISYSPPNPIVINDSIQNNIFYKSDDVHDINFLNSLANLDFLDLEKTEINIDSNSLSAGQIQRIDLARVFARMIPSIIILDEPTASLDALNTKNFISNLQELKQNKIIILVTHELDLLEMVDSVMIIDDGNLEEYPDIFNAMESSKTFKDLLASSSKDDNY